MVQTPSASVRKGGGSRGGLELKLDQKFEVSSELTSLLILFSDLLLFVHFDSLLLCFFHHLIKESSDLNCPRLVTIEERKPLGPTLFP